jgi:hypothetical protein
MAIINRIQPNALCGLAATANDVLRANEKAGQRAGFVYLL